MSFITACASWEPIVERNEEVNKIYQQAQPSDYDSWLTAMLYNDFHSAIALSNDPCKKSIAELFDNTSNKYKKDIIDSIVHCLHNCVDAETQNLGKYLFLIHSTLISNTYNDLERELAGRDLNQPNQVIRMNSDSIEFDIEVKNGRICLKIDIDNQNYLFWLDTGSPFSTITTKAISSINKENALNFKLRSFELDFVSIKRICISNNFFIENSCFHINNDPQFKEYSGLIGWNIFSRFPFKLDLKNNKITVYRSPKMYTGQRNLFGIEHPYIKFRNNDGVVFNFVLDTGLPTSFLHQSSITKFNPIIISSDTASFSWINNDQRKEEYKTAENLRLSTGSFTLTFDKYRLVNNTKFNFVYDGMLGTNILIGNSFYIDYPNGYFILE